MSEINHNIYIDTPENLTLEAEVAGFGSRFMAALIDYLILIVVLIIVSILFISAARNSGTSGDVLIGVYVLFQFVLFTFYHLIFEFLWNGQTPGKRLLGLRVVMQNGLPLSVTGLLIRNLVRLFDFFPVLYGVGFLVMFATKHTQRLGDLAARTIVIYERHQLTLQTLKENFAVRYHRISIAEPLPDYIDISHLTQTDRSTVVNYLQRRYEIRQTGEVALLLARKIAKQIGLDTPPFRTPVEAERFLEQVARAFEMIH